MRTGDQDIEETLTLARTLEGQGRLGDAFAAYQDAFERSGRKSVV